jgi:hypothetical protein
MSEDLFDGDGIRPIAGHPFLEPLFDGEQPVLVGKPGVCPHDTHGDQFGHLPEVTVHHSHPTPGQAGVDTQDAHIPPPFEQTFAG